MFVVLICVTGSTVEGHFVAWCFRGELRGAPLDRGSALKKGGAPKSPLNHGDKNAASYTPSLCLTLCGLAQIQNTFPTARYCHVDFIGRL